MELNQNEAHDNHHKVNNNENLNYLYPNGHRITHQMKWYKACRERVLASNIAA